MNLKRVITALLLFTMFSCSEKKNEVTKSEQNSAADMISDTTEVLLKRLFLDGKIKKLQLETATFRDAFVFESMLNQNSSKTDEQWRLELGQNDAIGKVIQCTAWFDTYLSGDQTSFYPKNQKTEKHLLQKRICTGPYNLADIKTKKQGFLSTIASYCSAKLKGESTKIYDWTTYRGISIKYHAAVGQYPDRNSCRPWKPNLSFENLMGTKINFSYTRTCIRTCDELQSDCSSSRTFSFQEFAEYPTPEYLEKNTSKTGNAICN